MDKIDKSQIQQVFIQSHQPLTVFIQHKNGTKLQKKFEALDEHYTNDAISEIYRLARTDYWEKHK